MFAKNYNLRKILTWNVQGTIIYCPGGNLARFVTSRLFTKSDRATDR